MYEMYQNTGFFPIEFSAATCAEKLGAGGGGGVHKVISQYVITKTYLIKNVFNKIENICGWDAPTHPTPPHPH